MTTDASSAETREFNGASFYEYLKEGRLMGIRCNACGKLSAEPRSMCPDCHGRDVVWHEFKGAGTLGAFTCISVVPQAMAAQGYGRDNPYCSGIVILDEGPRISALILGVDAANPQNIRTGMPLTTDFTNMDPDRPTLAFRPG
jgi:uncharacterized OB-fold protein